MKWPKKTDTRAAYGAMLICCLMCTVAPHWVGWILVVSAFILWAACLVRDYTLERLNDGASGNPT